MWLRVSAVLRLLRLFQVPKGAAYVAWGACWSGGLAENAGSAAVAAAAAVLLWAGFYGLNDLADVAADRQTPSKVHRPLVQGSLGAGEVWALSAAAIVAALALLGLASRVLLLVGALAVLNHVAYCFRPLRLKGRPGLDVASGAVVPAAVRVALGWASCATIGAALLPALFAPALLKSAMYLNYCYRDPGSRPFRGTVKRLTEPQVAALITGLFGVSFIGFVSFVESRTSFRDSIVAGTALYSACGAGMLLFRGGARNIGFSAQPLAAAFAGLAGRLQASMNRLHKPGEAADGGHP